MYAYTTDLSDGFFVKLWALCGELECSPLDLLGCWYSESGLHAAAHNHSGDASGIFQVMPSIAHGLGWDATDADLSRYRDLTAEEQLAWAQRYYAPHRGRLETAAACYVANFLPAFLPHADEPGYVLASTELRSTIYWANRAFDKANKGAITVGDLSAAIDRACTGPRWAEVVARVHASAPTVGA